MTATPEFLALQAALAGRFSLSHELGRGGMGVVFLAHDVRLERPVAIKLLAPHLAARAEMRRRFLREARIAAQCFHPHIVPIHAVEESGELAYFVMAYVRGETLAERLQRSGPLPPDDVRRIGRDIGWALAYAHERGVIHRDVKPENILLEDGTSRALIADFGIAVHDDPTRTPASGEIAGTARFMAPEQALGEPLDGRADLYALGVTLHVAATGRHPFDAANPVALPAAQSLRAAPSIRTLAPSLPVTLADGIDRCLALHPADRFANGAAFVAALEPTAGEAPEPEALRRLRDASDGALMLWGWAQVFQLTTRVLMWGEGPSFGRDIIEVLGTGVAVMTMIAALWRAYEAATLLRRSRRDGRAGPEVAAALAGIAPQLETQPAVSRSSRAQGAAVIAIGLALAYSQAAITGLAMQGSWGEFLQVVLLALPPVLVGRGLATAFRRSPATRWLQQRVRAPIAAFITRRMGWRTDAASTRRPAFESGHTEVRLEQVAERLLAALPPGMQQSLQGIPAAAAGLARAANACRARDAALVRAEAEARQLAPERRDSVLRQVARERAEVQERLATAIAGLETIRLDLLRLGAAESTDGLTSHLEVVHELQRRVDAEADVRVLLENRVRDVFSPEPTPA